MPVENKFDGKRARQARIETGIGICRLGRKLWPANRYSASSRINNIESGRALPSYPSGEFTEKYLIWLAKHGYDYFKILDEDTNEWYAITIFENEYLF